MGHERDYRARIAEIAGRTGWYHVFGAGYKGHGFMLTLHSRNEIALFEEQLGGRLPNEYAELLMETGSGAGPYYGLWAPGRILAQVETWNGIRMKEDGVLPSPSAPFPFQQADANEICSRQKIDPSESLGRATFPCDGCIPICCQGCTFYSVLVTAGEQVGKIWSVNEDGWPKAEWRPGIRPPGWWPGPRLDGSYAPSEAAESRFQWRVLPPPPIPPMFLEWYESWLERVEIDLNDFRDYQALDHLR